MKFAIITHAEHKLVDRQWFSYAPYVREMNLWNVYSSEVKVISPISKENIHSNELSYTNKNIAHVSIPKFNITSFVNGVKSLITVPYIFVKIFRVMFWADHIHLRCPGNVGLIGCVVQLFFPNKPKTIKYAGNWDPKSKQPRSYRLQKWLLSNTFLTKNAKVLVYGEWENQTKNIVSFFTASYSEREITQLNEKQINDKIKLIFVGSLVKGKQPLLSVQVAHELIKKNYNIVLNMYGEGPERETIENYIRGNKLEAQIILHGNVSKDVVKQSFQESHFLIFISKSEGWPKVVAEAMFWSCLPITTDVSCVSYMLGGNTRGEIVAPELNEITSSIIAYISQKEMYKEHVANATKWSQKYTLEKFDNEISKFFK